MYIALYNFLLMAIGQYYSADNIQQAYQSDIETDVTNYVEITELPTNAPNYYPSPSLNAATSTKTFTNLYITNWQIDFYGLNAEAAVNAFQLLLTGYANDWFTNNNYPYSVAGCKMWENLTEVIDSSSYILRFCIRFSLYSINEVSITVPTIDNIQIGVQNVDLILTGK